MSSTFKYCKGVALEPPDLVEEVDDGEGVQATHIGLTVASNVSGLMFSCRFRFVTRAMLLWK